MLAARPTIAFEIHDVGSDCYPFPVLVRYRYKAEAHEISEETPTGYDVTFYYLKAVLKMAFNCDLLRERR